MYVLGFQATRVVALDPRLAAAYDILGVRPGADARAVQRAFRRIVKRSHPDVSQRPESVVRFQRAVTAYRALSASESPTHTVVANAGPLPALGDDGHALRIDLAEAVTISGLCFIATVGALQLISLFL